MHLCIGGLVYYRLDSAHLVTRPGSLHNRHPCFLKLNREGSVDHEDQDAQSEKLQVAEALQQLAGGEGPPRQDPRQAEPSEAQTPRRQGPVNGPTPAMTLVRHPAGDYHFLPGIAPYSCGVAAASGHEIVHVVLRRPVPYRLGFDVIEDRLSRENRPRAALCAVELRSPRPFTFEGFATFNAEYSEILKSWGLFVDGVNPIARTNVAPAVRSPNQPVLYGFSYTRPCHAGDGGPSFVVAGAGELPEGVLTRDGVVRLGETDPAAIAEKARFVMDLMESRLLGLGVGWDRVTALNVYSVHSLDRIAPEIVLDRAGPAAWHGVRWHYSRPPILEIEYEMDLRGAAHEVFE